MPVQHECPCAEEEYDGANGSERIGTGATQQAAQTDAQNNKAPLALQDALKDQRKAFEEALKTGDAACKEGEGSCKKCEAWFRAPPPEGPYFRDAGHGEKGFGVAVCYSWKVNIKCVCVAEPPKKKKKKAKLY